ncbi:MAG: type II toxin-antitoxin system RelE/ParE family toxin [Candidatus Eremiobacteraeota bacterium]|nr:type II toxin-antitoxin system RelE/ParE family toxin [Candidatus Eremiobacteraeota bacterium]
MHFADKATSELFNGIASKASRKVIPAALAQGALAKLTLLEAAVNLKQFQIPPGNRLEALRGDREGRHSIRINDRYRICFRWTDVGAVDVEVVDYRTRSRK